jgi:hypothetical protein
MTDVSVTTLATGIVTLFPPSSNIREREFRVSSVANGGSTIRISRSKKALKEGGGIRYEPGEGKTLVGHPTDVGKPLYAVASAGTSNVERDES